MYVCMYIYIYVYTRQPLPPQHFERIFSRGGGVSRSAHTSCAAAAAAYV